MGWEDITKIFNRTETPDTKELALEMKKIKTEMRKTDVNSIAVEYYLRNSPYYIETIGTLHRTTNFTIVILENPGDLGLILMDDSIVFNKATKKEKILVKEGYPFTLNLNLELTRKHVKNMDKDAEKELKEINNNLTNELDEFKLLHPEVKEYIIPVLLNQIPLSVVRIKLNHKMADFPDEMDVTQNIIYQLFFAKILSKVNKQKVQGAFMLVLMGFLGGMVFTFAVTLLMGRV